LVICTSNSGLISKYLHKILTGDKLMITMTAFVDRIEDGCAILLSDYPGMEISVPLTSLKKECRKGDVLTLTIDDKRGEVFHAEG
jgi:hypothetical protein